MDKNTLEAIKSEAMDMKKIAEGDYSEIKKLEENPIVQKYLHLKALQDSPYGVRNNDDVVYRIMDNYAYGLINDTNDIWVYYFEKAVGILKERGFSSIPLDGYDDDQVLVIYKDLENGERLIAIREEEQKEFESTHKVTYGKESIYDSQDRYFNIRYQFFKSVIEENQEEAVKRVLGLNKRPDEYLKSWARK